MVRSSCSLFVVVVCCLLALCVACCYLLFVVSGLLSFVVFVSSCVLFVVCV